MSKFKNGFTFVEVLISIGIMSFVIAGSFYLMADFQRSYQGLKSKADLISAQSLIQNNFIRNVDCDCLIKGKIFNSADVNAVIDLREIKNGCATGGTSLVRVKDAAGGGEIVERIYLSDISATGNSEEYNAKVNIVPGEESSGMPARSLPLFLRFNTDPRTPADKKEILGCGPAPLSIPTGLKVQAGEKSCALSWNASAGAGDIRYVVKYSDQAGRAQYYGTNGCPPEIFSTNCTVSGLMDDKQYYFTVQAINNYGETEYATEVSCKPATLPSEIRDLTAEPGLKSCTLKWKAPEKGSPQIEYKIFKSPHIGQTVENRELVCSGSSLTCKVNGLLEGVTYYFGGLAWNRAGAGPLSSPDVECKSALVPSEPRELKVVGGDRRCDLAWDKPSIGDDPFYYSVYRSDNVGEAKTGIAVSGCQDLHSDIQQCGEPGLANHQRYYYIVMAYNNFGQTFSKEVMCTPGMPPGQITLSVGEGNGQCNLSWAEPIGDPPFYYSIYRQKEETPVGSGADTEPMQGSDGAEPPSGTQTGGESEQLGVVVCQDITEKACQVTGLANGVLYKFWGEVFSAHGSAGASAKVECTPKAL